MTEVRARMSVESYPRESGSEPGNAALDLGNAWENGDVDDWFVTVPMAKGEVNMLCCPEDQECVNGCESRGSACADCWVPVCAECKSDVEKPRTRGAATIRSVPPRSFANDLMTFYAPDRMYTEGMTVMEMLCCSPCITSMICFSLEVEFQSDAEEKPRKEVIRRRRGLSRR